MNSYSTILKSLIFRSKKKKSLVLIWATSKRLSPLLSIYPSIYTVMPIVRVYYTYIPMVLLFCQINYTRIIKVLFSWYHLCSKFFKLDRWLNQPIYQFFSPVNLTTNYLKFKTIKKINSIVNLIKFLVSLNLFSI